MQRALLVVCGWLLIGSAAPLLGGEEPETPDPRQLEFFEKRIRPVLVAHCYECHSTQSKRVRGSLLLDTRAGIRKGGDTGPAVVPGNAADSLIIQALRQDGLEMPPKGKLPDAVLKDFERWVEDGAVDPRAGSARVREAGWDMQKAREFWSFQPLEKPPVPSVGDTRWPRSSIDRFILARLESHGLSPAPDVDRPTLIRRLYFDLIGLPPTPEQIDAFVNDPSPCATEHVVDRLLETPQFGERWGRHWLDVSRFAESSGGGRTRIFADAWRYRDYVIRSFNADKPLDRFITEQIAGDLLPYDTPSQRAEQLIATTFLVLGPTNYELQDKDLLRMEVVDEQLDTVGRAFLGMTIGCARCHDHKFDPIPTADYYALAGFFYSTKTLIHKNVSDFVERELPVAPEHRRLLDEHATNVQRVEADLKAATSKLTEWTQLAADAAARGTGGGSAPAGGLPEQDPQQRIEQLRRQVSELKEQLDQLRKSAPEPPPVTMGVIDEETPEDCPLCIRGNVHNAEPAVPRGFLTVVADGARPELPSSESGRRQLAEWMTGADHPLTSRVMANRIWHYLFGQGIVRTVDNFGSMGERPSHPQLLDWLAATLIEDGWSLKRSIRRIVLSRTYQMESRPAARNAANAENRWLAHMNRRRLDAEAIRDSVLSVSGRLDLNGGGPTIRNGTKSEFGYQFESCLRSVYVPVFRNNLHDLFEAFDFPDPNLVAGRRNTSTLPTQALFLMNSPFIAAESLASADRLLAGGPVELPEGIRTAYRRALGRSPSSDEMTLAQSLFADVADLSLAAGQEPVEARRTAWAMLFQSLFCCIDFRYLH